MQKPQPEPMQGELVERPPSAAERAAVFPTITLEQFVDHFIARIKQRPDVVEFQSKVLAAVADAKAHEITDAASYQRAFEILGTIAGLMESGKDKRLEITRPIDAAKKRVMDVFAPDDQLLGEQNTALRRRAGTFKDEQDRKEREERQKREAAAEAERVRLENEARARRQEAEAEAQRKREEAAMLAAGGDHRAAARAESAAAAVVEKAEAAAVNLERRSEAVVAEPTRTSAPKVAGVAGREVWDFEVLDAKKLSPLFTMPDEVKIRAAVKQHKRDAPQIVGEGSIRVFPTTDFNVKKRR